MGKRPQCKGRPYADRLFKRIAKTFTNGKKGRIATVAKRDEHTNVHKIKYWHLSIPRIQHITVENKQTWNNDKHRAPPSAHLRR